MKLKSLLAKIDDDVKIILKFTNGAICCSKNEIGKSIKNFNVEQRGITILNNCIMIKTDDK